MELDLYVFSSKSRENIEIAVRRRIWAIPTPSGKGMQRQFATKAQKMPIGAHGVFYLSDKQWFTTPFIVGSQPDVGAVIDDIWDGTFFCPFRIHPLSAAWPWVTKSKIKQILPTLHGTGSTWDQRLYI
jgi:hypothetical protein